MQATAIGQSSNQPCRAVIMLYTPKARASELGVVLEANPELMDTPDEVQQWALADRKRQIMVEVQCLISQPL